MLLSGSIIIVVMTSGVPHETKTMFDIRKTSHTSHCQPGPTPRVGWSHAHLIDPRSTSLRGSMINLKVITHTPSYSICPHAFEICTLISFCCSEWTETFPYDFRDERMMKALKDITQACAGQSSVSLESSWCNRSIGLPLIRNYTFKFLGFLMLSLLHSETTCTGFTTA